MTQRQASSCPIRTNLYGGLPSGGGFGSFTEFEVGAQAIAEAAHCLLGSLGRNLGEEGDWNRMRLIESGHIREELGIIERVVGEYSKPLYEARLNDFSDYFDQESARSYAVKTVESIRAAAPLLKSVAQTKGRALSIQKDVPVEILNTGLAAYLVVAKLSDAMVASVEGWPARPATNPYRDPALENAVQKLKVHVQKMFQAGTRVAKTPTSTDTEEMARILRKQWAKLLKGPLGLEGWRVRGSDARQAPFSEWYEAMVNPHFFQVRTSEVDTDQLAINLPLRVVFYFQDEVFPALITQYQKQIENLAKTNGWFVKSSKDRRDRRLLTLEKRRSPRVREVPRFVWHATPFENVEKILRRGLLPRNKTLGEDTFQGQVLERKYPERIYLATTLQHAKEISLLLEMHRDLSKNDIAMVHQGLIEETPFILLKIDTTKVKGANFHIDPDFRKGGVYTYTKIPPSAIEIEASDLKEYEAFRDQVMGEERYVAANRLAHDLCSPNEISSGWIEPNGKYHTISRGDHESWAERHINQHLLSEYEQDRTGGVSRTDFLLRQGWVRVGNAFVLQVWNMASSGRALRTAAEQLVDCCTQGGFLKSLMFDPEKPGAVLVEGGNHQVWRFSVADFVARFGSRSAEERLYGGLLTRMQRLVQGSKQGPSLRRVVARYLTASDRSDPK